MAPRTLAYVTPEVLLWARESAGYSVEDAANAIDLSWSELETVEQGYDLLTLRQAEKLATLYGRPLATLFLSEPPAEEPQDTQFRRLPGAPAPPWPAAMRLLARRIRERQDSAIELYDALDEEPPWTTRATDFVARDRASLPRVAREVFGIGRDEQTGWSEKYAPLRRPQLQRHSDAPLGSNDARYLQAPGGSVLHASGGAGNARRVVLRNRPGSHRPVGGTTHPREGSNVMREVPRNTTGASMLNPEVGVELRRLTKAPR